MDIYLLSDFRDILRLLTQSQSITNKTYRDVAVGAVFGMPESAREFIASDDSGLSNRSDPRSQRLPHHRIDYLTHASLGKLIHGPGLKPLAQRFSQNLKFAMSRLGDSMNGDEWQEMPDLFTFMNGLIFESSVPAMFGKQLLKDHPTFCDDFWRFDSGVPDLAKAIPRLIYPKPYNARDRCLDILKKHHRFLRQACEDWSIDRNMLEYSDIYGTGLIRYRQHMWSKMEAMNDDARAAEDLGMIWG